MCSLVKAKSLPRKTFGERPPQVGDLIFLDTNSRFFKWHKSYYLVLNVDGTGNFEALKDLFDFFTTVIVYNRDDSHTTPLNLRATDGYWLLGEHDV